MVWASITADGLSPLIFIDRGIKIYAEYYRKNNLKTVLKPWADKHFLRRPWTFQQNWAAPHSADVNQEWLKKKVPLFIYTAQWPQKSSDLNPLDFWRVRFSLKNIKLTIVSRRRFAGNGIKFRSLWWLCRPFEGHNSYRKWPIRTNLNWF